MRFFPEPPHTHGTALHSARTAVLLCNLGTPDEPTASALRRYLAEFLSDTRVVELPRTLWWPILHGIVLRLRPSKSAAKYASIWTPDGSPLRVWVEKQAKLLGGYLGERGHKVTVAYAMRYGSPSVANALTALKSAGATRILVLPLYPQYSGPTTGSVVDAVAAWAQRTRAVPELRFVSRYHDDTGYITALAKRVTDHWMACGRPDKLVMSFHGLPQRALQLGDPYHCECHKTARMLAEHLQLKADAWTVTFQSRFGKAKWLQPYTEPTLRLLAAEGIKRVDLICPGFTSDCLETLSEIDHEARAVFLAAGGKEFHYIAALNGQHEWMAALSAIAIRHMSGWDTQSLPDKASLEAQRARAVALGASD